MLVSSPTPSALLARYAMAAGLQHLPFLLTWILSPMSSPTSPSVPSSSPSSAVEASIKDWRLVDPNPFLKPWASLPSFLPWFFSPLPPARSCETYFGHGFSRRINVLYSSSSSTGGKGWFQCYYSETLASSICEGGKPSPSRSSSPSRSPSLSPAHPHHCPISNRPLCAAYLPLLFPRNPNPPSLPSSPGPSHLRRRPARVRTTSAMTSPTGSMPSAPPPTPPPEAASGSSATTPRPSQAPSARGVG